MAAQKWTIDKSIVELERLIAPEVLGFYTHFEVIEVFAQTKNTKSAFNVFTIVIAEDRLDAGEEAPKILTPKRIKISSLPDWCFGIKRYTRLMNELIPAVRKLSDTGEWQQSKENLQFGEMQPRPPQFSHPDAIEQTAWNRILKNNFWNGCHIFEWSDQAKMSLLPLLDDPKLIQELTNAIDKFVPINLASLSDRLGNLVVQLPVTVLMSHFGQSHDSSAITVEAVWHPKATPRELYVSCEVAEADGAIPSYFSGPINGNPTTLKVQADRGSHKARVWDEKNQIILAATGASAFIHTVTLNMATLDPEPRVFTTQEPNGTKTQRIALTSRRTQSVIGEPISERKTNWVQKRVYAEEAVKLAEERRFIQYRPDGSGQDVMRQKALSDLRYLINRYGQYEVWLWDPYLCARDILDTLFHCVYRGARLAALGALQEKELAAQSSLLTNLQGNSQGLNCEYRNSHGGKGWNFHDRFLIFPNSDHGALAWSLGTSVRSVGESHHILQQVSDAELICQAFKDLWDRLDHTQHLVWKTP